MPTYKNTVGGANPEKRTKPRVNVLRGYPGNETTALTRSLPPKASEGIKSGMAIAVGTGADAGLFVKADGSEAANLVFIAYHDQGDTDVISSGKLLGFSALGGFELETGYWGQGPGGADPVDGDAICVDTTTPGGLTTVSAGEAPIGYATSDIIDWSNGQYSNSVANMAQNTEAGATGSKVLRLATSA